MKIQIELIQRCIGNDREAQKDLYNLLLPYLAAVCKRYLINLSDINDVLQDTFIQIFKNIHSFDASKGNFKTWSTRIAINCSIKVNHKVKRVPITEFINDYHDKTIEPEILHDLSAEDILIFLKEMPIEYFEVFNLNLIDGFSHKEISLKLKISESLSRKRLSRARKWIAGNVDRLNAIKNSFMILV
ncbi:MAG: RNA polymerase sigma factor [Bacteroidota bacterium]